jgi:hypothetical protein
MDETEDDRLCISFMAPAESGGLVKASEFYECFEMAKILRLFKKIKSQIISTRPSHTANSGAHTILTKEKPGAA